MADIRRFELLDSTNDEARRLARTGAEDGLWVVAEGQTQGRGRHGRGWISPANGNLYCSCVVHLHPQEQPTQHFSFVAVLALYDVLKAYVPDVQVKWPNDLVVKGHKISGILLERADLKSGPLIVGIGVNLAAHPDKTVYPATNMKALTGHAPHPYEVLTELAARFNHWRSRWRAEGFEMLRQAWLTVADGLGSRIVARLPQESVVGIFTGLADDGALMLLLDTGDVRLIHAADIFGI